MRKQSAVIKHRKGKVVEKSILMSKAIQLKMDFEIQCSAWVPRALPNKPMPQVNLTLNVSYDDLRIGTNTTDELIDGLMEIVAFLEKNKNNLDNSVKEEQKRWNNLANAQFEATQKPKVVEMRKVG
jgi:hypothetical protein